MEKGTEAIDAFEAPFKKDFAELPATSHVMGENHIRRKVKAYGPFLLELIETEVTGPRGSSFYPWLVSATITDGDVLQARRRGSRRRPGAQGGLRGAALRGGADGAAWNRGDQQSRARQ